MIAERVYKLHWHAENIADDGRVEEMDDAIMAALEREFTTIAYKISRRYGGSIKMTTDVEKI